MAYERAEILAGAAVLAVAIGFTVYAGKGTDARQVLDSVRDLDSGSNSHLYARDGTFELNSLMSGHLLVGGPPFG